MHSQRKTRAAKKPIHCDWGICIFYAFDPTFYIPTATIFKFSSLKKSQEFYIETANTPRLQCADEKSWELK